MLAADLALNPDSAALLVYFYVKFEKDNLLPTNVADCSATLQEFIAYWARLGKLEAVAQATLDKPLLMNRWGQSNGTGEQVVLSRVHPSVHDALVVTLVRPLPGEVVAAWQHAREAVLNQLRTFLCQQLSAAAQAELLDDLLGCSLFYVANPHLPADSLPNEPPVLTQGAALAMGIPRRKPLASAAYGRGWFQLYARPSITLRSQYDAPLTTGTDIDAFSVYLALTDTKRTELYIPEKAQLGPDTIAHKSYYQALTLLEKAPREGMNTTLSDVFVRAQELMNEFGDTTSSDEKNGELEREINALAHQYGSLLGKISHVYRTENSLERQLLNLEAYTRTTKAVWQYHHAIIERYLQDIKLLIGKSNVASQAAQTAISFVRQRQDRQKNELQQRHNDYQQQQDRKNNELHRQHEKEQQQQDRENAERQRQHDKEQHQRDRENNDAQHRRGVLLAGLGLILALMSLLKGPVILALYHRWPWPWQKGIINSIGPSADIHGFIAEFVVLLVLITGMSIFYRWYKRSH